MNLSNSELYAKWNRWLAQIMPDDLTHVKYRLKNMLLACVCLYKAGHIHLSHIAGSMPVPVKKKSLTERLRRLMANEAIVVRDWYRPVAVDMLQAAASDGEMCLAIDTTKVSSQYQLIMVGVAYHERTMPVIWDWVPYPQGHCGVDAQIEVLNDLRALIPDQTQVTLVGDSEFGHVPLLEVLDEWGWQYVLRQKGSYHVRPEGCAGWHRLDEIPLESGDWCPLGDVQMTGEHAYPTRFVAYWQDGQDRPWLLATNIDCLLSAVRFYDKRNWLEQFFGDMKGHGFNLEHSRLGTADRLSRLTLIACLVYVWLAAAGEYVLEHDLRSWVDRPDRRDLSLFRLGWDLIKRILALIHHEDCPPEFATGIPDVFIPSFSKVYGS